MGKFYAVHNGRQGTQIYLDWDTCKANVSRVPGVIYKSFRYETEAHAWLQGIADATAVDAAPPYHQRKFSAAQRRGDPGPSTVRATYQRSMPRYLKQIMKYEDHPVKLEVNEEYDDIIEVKDEDEDDDYFMEVKDETDDDHMKVETMSQFIKYESDSEIQVLETPSQFYRSQTSSSSASYDFDDDGFEILDGPPLSAARTRASARFSAAANPRDPISPPRVEEEEEPPLTAPEGILNAGPVRTVMLSPEQQFVLAEVQRGESVFFTGSAGTGKSVLLREIIKTKGGRAGKFLGITASTGIASVNIGGCTLHSWAGIGLGKEDKDALVGKIYGIAKKAWKDDQNKRRQLAAKRARGEQLTADEILFLNTDPEKTRRSKIIDRWRNVRTLIIDEISMIDGKLFDKLEYVARKIRKNEMPFGGIQLVLSGDFCQLPPVPDKDIKGAQIPACFAFDAGSWKRCVGPPFVLKKVFRQKDQTFVDMLNAMRFGKIDAKTTNLFRNLSRTVEYTDGIEPTELYPTRNEVNSANTARLNTLEGSIKNYEAKDAPGRDEHGNPYPFERVERALRDVIAPKKLPLKVGAQVMLIKNVIQGLLVNGSLGRVVGFYKPREAVAMGADIAIPELARPSQTHVQVEIEDEIPAEQVKVQEEQRDQKLKKILATNSVWPAVQFVKGPLMLCVPLLFEVNNADGGTEAVREQVPLILAWALSIHKSQGQTLERVRVDLGRIFEKGQAYVALSRATQLETLQVLSFDPAKVRAHPRVLEWMMEHDNKVPDAPDAQASNRHDVDIDEELEMWQDIL